VHNILHRFDHKQRDGPSLSLSLSLSQKIQFSLRFDKSNRYCSWKRVRLWRHLADFFLQWDAWLFLNLGAMRAMSFMSHLLFPGGSTAGTHWVGGWLSPISGLDTSKERKIVHLCCKSYLDISDVLPVDRSLWGQSAEVVRACCWHISFIARRASVMFTYTGWDLYRYDMTDSIRRS